MRWNYKTANNFLYGIGCKEMKRYCCCYYLCGFLSIHFSLMKFWFGLCQIETSQISEIDFINLYPIDF